MTVYLIIEESGEYDDYMINPVGVWDTHKAAIEECERLDKVKKEILAVPAPCTVQEYRKTFLNSDKYKLYNEWVRNRNNYIDVKCYTVEPLELNQPYNKI